MYEGSKNTSEPASEQVGLKTTLSSDIASGLGERFDDGDVGGHEDWLFLSGPDEDGKLEDALTDGKWKDMEPDVVRAWLGSRKAKSPLGNRLGITESPAKSFPFDAVVGDVLLFMSPLVEDREAGTMPTVEIPAGIWTLRDCNIPGNVFPKLRLEACCCCCC